jgi:electron transfer flavoprotein alpha subunit
VAELQTYPGLNKIFVAKHDALHNPYSKGIALISKSLIKAKGHDKVLAASNGFGKDLVPRIGGLLDVQAITDVCRIIEGGAKFVRPVYAGNAMSTVSTIDPIKLLTIRGTNFEKVKPSESANSYPTEEAPDVDEIMGKLKGRWLENIVAKSEMADLTTAKYVVSGGRALKSSENFKLLHDIAQTIGLDQCAIGASRAAVDAGYVSNEL